MKLDATTNKRTFTLVLSEEEMEYLYVIVGSVVDWNKSGQLGNFCEKLSDACSEEAVRYRAPDVTWSEDTELATVELEK